MARQTTNNLDVYKPRTPKESAYYKCIENHFEALERVYPEGQKLSTFWRFLANGGIFAPPAIKKSTSFTVENEFFAALS